VLGRGDGGVAQAKRRIILLLQATLESHVSPFQAPIIRSARWISRVTDLERAAHSQADILYMGDKLFSKQSRWRLWKGFFVVVVDDGRVSDVLWAER
jgi:hypothetical protein